MRKVAFILLWLYVFTLPWDNILQFGEPIGSIGRVAALIAFAGTAALVATKGNMHRLQPFHIATAAYLVMVALSALWSADPENTPHYARVYVQSALVVWLLWELVSDQRALLQLALAYVAGAYLAAFSIYRGFSSSTIAAGAKEARFTAENWDANDLALVLALGIPLALYAMSKKTHWTNTWLARGYLVLGPMGVILTSSRSGIVVTAVALCALPFFLLRQRTTTKLAMVLILICAGYVAWNYAPAQSWSRLSTVFSSVRAGDFNDRQLIWQTALRSFGNNCVLGVGAGAFQSGIGSYYTAHNTFLAVLVEQGLVGFGIFSVILCGAIFGIGRLKEEDRWMCISLLLCWAVGAFTLGWAMHRVTWFVLGFVFSCAYIHHKETRSLGRAAGWQAEFATGENA